MQKMLVEIPTETLSEIGERRGLYLLSKEKVELRWDWLSYQLRAIDLQVLCSEFNGLYLRLNIDANEDFALCINDQVLILTRYDLMLFQKMIHEAIEQLPRRVVRWKEIRLSIEAYCSDKCSKRLGFSMN